MKTAARVIGAAAALSLLAGCGRLSKADEEDVSCLLAEIAAFGKTNKADQGTSSKLTLALTQSALYRIGRLQGRHGDDRWTEVIDRIDPEVMQVRLIDKVQACSQTENFRNLLTDAEFRAAVGRLDKAGSPPR